MRELLEELFGFRTEAEVANDDGAAFIKQDAYKLEIDALRLLNLVAVAWR